MKPKSLLAVLCLVLVSFGARAGLAEDMAAFERIYIPALALTNQPQQPAERVAASMQRVTAEWPRYMQAFLAAGNAPQAAIRNADQAIQEAQALLAAGKRAEAHDALEKLRAALMEGRRSAAVDLYVDRLTEFHDVMEELVIMAGKGVPAEKLKPQLDQASGLWRRAENPRFDAALFGFDAAKYDQLRKRVEGERGIIESLDKALAANDQARIQALAKELKTSFSQIYVMFGDFRAP